MTDNLRDRIAVVHQAHVYRIGRFSNTAECACGETFRTSEWVDTRADLQWQWAQHLADVLIAAGVIMLRLQKPVDGACNRPITRDVTGCRCVCRLGHDGECW